MTLLRDIAAEVLRTFLLASPFIVLGLGMAGLVHVLLPKSLIERWLGRPGLGGVALAALVGVPLPVCSCGVVPLAVELRRKGASRPASLSFLITTPESSVDSILFTWGLMGPVLAAARPAAAFLTALLGGSLAMSLPDDDEPGGPSPADLTPSSCGCGDGCGDALEAVSPPPSPVSPPNLQGAGGPEPPPATLRHPSAPTAGFWNGTLRPAFRYGFGELLDDLAFWLVLGIGVAGALGALMPADLAHRGLGSGLVPMLILLLAGIPLYMCASASTPIAAALLAKGVSPGAALVFLLAGPATNVATLVLLVRTFGRRFVASYLTGVVAGALISGVTLDALMLSFGWRISAPLMAADSTGLEVVEWASFLVLGTLLVASLARGAGRRGWRELVDGLRWLVPAGGGS